MLEFPASNDDYCISSCFPFQSVPPQTKAASATFDTHGRASFSIELARRKGFFGLHGYFVACSCAFSAGSWRQVHALWAFCMFTFLVAEQVGLLNSCTFHFPKLTVPGVGHAVFFRRPIERPAKAQQQHLHPSGRAPE